MKCTTLSVPQGILCQQCRNHCQHTAAVTKLRARRCHSKSWSDTPKELCQWPKGCKNHYERSLDCKVPHLSLMFSNVLPLSKINGSCWPELLCPVCIAPVFSLYHVKIPINLINYPLFSARVRTVRHVEDSFDDGAQSLLIQPLMHIFANFVVKSTVCGGTIGQEQQVSRNINLSHRQGCLSASWKPESLDTSAVLMNGFTRGWNNSPTFRLTWWSDQGMTA